jgi:hypothetical protein
VNKPNSRKNHSGIIAQAKRRVENWFRTGTAGGAVKVAAAGGQSAENVARTRRPSRNAK